MAFDRKMELTIGVFKDAAFDVSLDRVERGRQSGYLIDGLDYEFDIKRSSEYYNDTATFTIYNPNDETIQEIMNAGCSVIFRAGYADEDMATIFVGQIAMAYPEDDGPETTKLILICKSQRGSQYPLQRTDITTVVDEGKSYYDVLKTIADYVGVALSGAEVLKDRKLASPYIVSGNIRHVVSEFTRRKLRALGGDILISNNEMIYYEKNSITFSTVYLNYGSGLKSATVVRDETFQSTEDAFNVNREYYLGKDWNKLTKDEKDELLNPKIQSRNEVNFECIFHPGLHVLTPVYIDARKSKDDHFSVLGEFYIKELEYKGGNFAGTQYTVTGRAYEYTTGQKVSGNSG